MKRVLWHIRRVATGIGVPGFTGLTLIVAAVLLSAGPVQWAQQDISQFQQAIAQARLHSKSTPLQVDMEGQLAGFNAFFPARQTLSSQLHQLHEVTREHGILMGAVNYQLSSVNGTLLKRYEIDYSLVTDYPTLRVYLATLLNTLPNAALEDIELQRSGEDASMLEARLNLVLYLRDDHARK